MERESQEFYAEAIRDFNVQMATCPPVTKKHASAQRKGWEKYVKFIDPKTIREKIDKKKNPMKGLFNMAIVPVIDEQVEKQKESETK